MSNINIVDVDFEENKYHTLEDVARITNLNEAKISFYCTKLKDFLNIQSIGMYQIFSDVDIDNLNKIKKLEADNNMSIKEIEEYLKKNKQEVLLKKENNQIDVSVLEIFANILKMQNEKIDQIININQQLVEIINKNNLSNQLLIENTSAIKEEIKETINTAIEEKINTLDISLDSKINSITNSIKEEMKPFRYITKEEIESYSKKKNWFERLFK